MKRELKPFVVEVKRGKRRQSFLEQVDDDASTMSEATRRAERALFANPGAEGAGARSQAAAEPAGRILPSLIEPPPPEPEAEEPAPRRRGRKPGSKNKPKPPPEPSAAAPEPASNATLPRLSEPEGDPEADPELADEFDEEATVAEPRPSTTLQARRPRLRHRSKILARYVHGTAPAPGQSWLRHTRRRKRPKGGSTPA